MSGEGTCGGYSFALLSAARSAWLCAHGGELGEDVLFPGGGGWRCSFFDGDPSSAAAAAAATPPPSRFVVGSHLGGHRRCCDIS